MANVAKCKSFTNYGARAVHFVKVISVGSTRMRSTDAERVRPFEDIPGPRSNRFLGTLPQYLPFFGRYSMERMHENARLNYTLYGKLVRERMMPSVNILHVYDPADLEALLRCEGRYPERRSHLALLHYRKSKPHVYETGGLLPTNGPEWWRLRSSFQKYLNTPQSVRCHVGRTDGIAREFVDWVSAVGDIDDIVPYLNRMFLENICSVAFGIRVKSFEPHEQAFDSVTSRLIRAAFESNSGVIKMDHGFLWRFFETPLYRRMKRSQEYLENFSLGLLREKMNFYKSENVEVSSILDSFLALEHVGEKDFLGMMVDILMAAVDTTSYSTSFLLYHLAMDSTKQDLLFQECEQLLPHPDDEIIPETLSKAVYAKACIRESLRLNPVSVGVGRVLKSDIVLSGYHVPKETIVVTQNMVACRLHQYCKDPDTYRPERWLKTSEHHENIHPFLSLPFGFGTRSCIARRLAEQSMCITLLRVIRKFTLDWKGGLVKIKTVPINKPDGPMPVKMKLRSG